MNTAVRKFKSDPKKAPKKKTLMRGGFGSEMNKRTKKIKTEIQPPKKTKRKLSDETIKSVVKEVINDRTTGMCKSRKKDTFFVIANKE